MYTDATFGGNFYIGTWRKLFNLSNSAQKVHELWIHVLVEIRLSKFRFIQLKLQVPIRKIKNIKIGKNTEPCYVAANYWSALFRCDRDGPTASVGGLAVLGPFSVFQSCLIYILVVAMWRLSALFCVGIPFQWILCGIGYFVAIVLCFLSPCGDDGNNVATVPSKHRS
jgi:hypothetical protein